MKTKMREYRTYASPGSKEARRRRALARKETVLDYCTRHALPAPTTADEVRRIDHLALLEACARIAARCEAVRKGRA